MKIIVELDVSIDGAHAGPDEVAPELVRALNARAKERWAFTSMVRSVFINEVTLVKAES